MKYIVALSILFSTAACGSEEERVVIIKEPPVMKRSPNEQDNYDKNRRKDSQKQTQKPVVVATQKPTPTVSPVATQKPGKQPIQQQQQTMIPTQQDDKQLYKCKCGEGLGEVRVCTVSDLKNGYEGKVCYIVY